MEQPNLTYVEQLARGDENIRQTLIDIIKTEFPEEKKEYHESLEKKITKKLKKMFTNLNTKLVFWDLRKVMNALITTNIIFANIRWKAKKSLRKF
jgi:hypothetical protein